MLQLKNNFEKTSKNAYNDFKYILLQILIFFHI